METITEGLQTQRPAVTGLLADLAAVTDRVGCAVRAADPDAVGMPTAGALLAATDRLFAAVVEVLSKVSHRGVIASEGLSAGAWLQAFAARTIADERMLAAAAERLGDMPAVRAWFADGILSWPAVRGIVAAVRNLTGAQRGWVDASLAGDADRIRSLDADDLVAAVQALADEARPELQRDREQRAFQQQYLRVQQGFDGSSEGHFRLDAEATATLLSALDSIHANHTTDSDSDRNADPDADRDAPGDHDRDAEDDADLEDAGDAEDAKDGGVGRDGFIRRREWSNVQALMVLCRQRLGAAGGTAPSPARPSMLVIADLADLAGEGDRGVVSATAQLLLRSARGPVELTSAAAQRLACDATLRAIITHGGEILGAGAAHPAVSAALRAALVARDGGCRFPACHQPAEACDNHHLTPKAQGGPTVLENLALLCPAHHHAVHDGGWTATLHPDASMTFTRRGVTLGSLARASRRITPTRPPPAGRPRRRRPDPDDRHDTTTTVPTSRPPPRHHLPF